MLEPRKSVLTRRKEWMMRKREGPCLPSLRMRRPGHRPAHRRRLSPPRRARSRQLVCDPRTPARPRRAAPPDRRGGYPTRQTARQALAQLATPGPAGSAAITTASGWGAGCLAAPPRRPRPCGLRRARAAGTCSRICPILLAELTTAQRAGHVHRDHPPAPGHRPPGDGRRRWPGSRPLCAPAETAAIRHRPDHPANRVPPMSNCSNRPAARMPWCGPQPVAHWRAPATAPGRGVDRRADRPVPSRHPR